MTGTGEITHALLGYGFCNLENRWSWFLYHYSHYFY